MKMKKKAAMFFQIKPSSGIPIYRQIIDQVCRLVASGFLKPGDALPSIREVAGSFEINQMTISKAYTILEARGILEHNRGKRMVVAAAQQGSKSLEERLRLIRPAFEEVLTQAHQLALPKEVILKEFRKILEDKDD